MKALRTLLALSATLALTVACGGVKDVNETHTGTLTDDDARLPDDNSPYDSYEVRLGKGQNLRIDLASADFDTYLVLRRGNEIVQRNDDCPNPPSGNSLDSCIEMTVEQAGTYEVIANALFESGRGAYTLTINAAKP